MLPLIELVKVLAVINNSADRGICGGRDFHQVEALAACELQRLERRHNTKLLALFVNHTELFGTDPLIDADKSISDRPSLPARWGQPSFRLGPLQPKTLVRP